MATVAIAGSTFTFPIALHPTADTKLLLDNPTIGAADFRKSVNGGALVALDNIPTVTPAGGCQVLIVLSAAETTAAGAGGYIAVYWRDAVGAQWCSDGCVVFVFGAEVAQLGDAMTLTGAYDAAKLAAPVGAAMTLTAAYDAAKTAAQAGDAMTVTAGTLTSIAAAVWNRLTTALTTVGSIGKYLLDKLALITSGSISVTSPIVAGGSVTTFRGDSYLNADGRALDWQDATFPTLTGATITVKIEDGPTFVGSAAAADTARLELTTTQTLSIPPGRHHFRVIATLGALTATLVNSAWQSYERLED